MSTAGDAVANANSTRRTAPEWLGTLPPNWRIIRLRHLARSLQTGPFGSQLHSEEYVVGGTPLINPANLSDGKIVPNENWTVDPSTLERLSRHCVEAGDILFARRGDLGRCALVTAREAGWLCGTGSIRMRPNLHLVDPEFLNFVLATSGVADWLGLESVGSTMDNLSTAILAGLRLPVPDLHQQRAIVAFLHRETARIDALIGKKERLIGLLEEKRAALINRAVIKGLNPNAPMKESRIPWLGSVPAHWDARRLKFVLHGIEQGWSPDCENRQAEENEWGVLKVGCVNGTSFNETEHKALPPAVVPLREFEIRAGDILMSRANTRELLGSAALVRAVRPRLLLCDKLYRLRPTCAIRSDFLIHVLRSQIARFQYERDATGASSSMQNIGQDTVRELLIPLPPSTEQEAIAAFIDRKADNLDEAVRTAREQIGKFQEYRTALISAAVTGKIDVRDRIASEKLLT